RRQSLMNRMGPCSRTPSGPAVSTDCINRPDRRLHPTNATASIYPLQRGTAAPVGMSQTCHFQTHAPQQIGRWAASLVDERGGFPLARARQYDLKLREHSGLDRDIDRATVLLHDNVVAHR